MTKSLGLSALSTRIVVIATFVLPSCLVQAAEPKWPTEPYNFIVVDQNVRDTLTEFGRNNNIPVNLSPRVKGRVKGKLPTLPSKEFLQKITEDYSLAWYYDGNLLHISSEAENTTEIVRPAAGSAAAAKTKLQDMGLLDDRYGFQVSPDGLSATISGPPAYRAAVQGVLSTMTVERVRVFRGNPAAS